MARRAGVAVVIIVLVCGMLVLWWIGALANDIAERAAGLSPFLLFLLCAGTTIPHLVAGSHPSLFFFRAWLRLCVRIPAPEEPHKDFDIRKKTIVDMYRHQTQKACDAKPGILVGSSIRDIHVAFCSSGFIVLRPMRNSTLFVGCGNRIDEKDTTRLAAVFDTVHSELEMNPTAVGRLDLHRLPAPDHSYKLILVDITFLPWNDKAGLYRMLSEIQRLLAFDGIFSMVKLEGGKTICIRTFLWSLFVAHRRA
jgi:hypothetical protein